MGNFFLVRLCLRATSPKVYQKVSYEQAVLSCKETRSLGAEVQNCEKTLQSVSSPDNRRLDYRNNNTEKGTDSKYIH